MNLIIFAVESVGAYLFCEGGCGTVAQLEECPSKVPVWHNSTGMGLSHAAAYGGSQKNPSVAVIRAFVRESVSSEEQKYNVKEKTRP